MEGCTGFMDYMADSKFVRIEAILSVGGTWKTFTLWLMCREESLLRERIPDIPAVEFFHIPGTLVLPRENPDSWFVFFESSISTIDSLKNDISGEIKGTFTSGRKFHGASSEHYWKKSKSKRDILCLIDIARSIKYGLACSILCFPPLIRAMTFLIRVVFVVHLILPPPLIGMRPMWLLLQLIALLLLLSLFVLPLVPALGMLIPQVRCYALHAPGAGSRSWIWHCLLLHVITFGFVGTSFGFALGSFGMLGTLVVLSFDFPISCLCRKIEKAQEK